ncbi:putative DNA topoisomerase (ATP-hydrolyzing) [Helianthus debilis subsp. tardiflorus]
MVEAHIYVISGTIAQWYFSKDDARVKQHTAFSKSEERLRILDAYRTGKGCVVVRGKAEIEISDSKTKSAAIVVKEIPYQNNKSSLVMKNAELIQNKSDRSGMRIVIELKRGSDPAIVLNNLYRFIAATWLVIRVLCILHRRTKFRNVLVQLQVHL